MRAYQVLEHIEFKRGQKSKDALEVGHHASIRKRINDIEWMDEWIRQIDDTYGTILENHLSYTKASQLAERILIHEDDYMFLWIEYEAKDPDDWESKYDEFEAEYITPLEEKGWKVFYQGTHDNQDDFVLLKPR